MKKAAEKLLSVRNIVALLMTVCMVVVLLSGAKPEGDILALFCTSYGAIITRLFTGKEGADHDVG